MTENETTETTEETVEETEQTVDPAEIAKALTFYSYAEFAKTTAVYSDAQKVMYPTLGLAGEAGEVAEKIKKIFRDKSGQIEQEDRVAIAKELGDVLWYVTALARDLKIDLHDVAILNVQKLKDRQERNQLHGDGDDR